jgi:hypothetical protein
MKNYQAMAVGTALQLAACAAYAATGSMLNRAPAGESWMSGIGGVWVPLLFAVVVFALLMWDYAQIRVRDDEE